jgi:hypothetical protein
MMKEAVMSGYPVPPPQSAPTQGGEAAPVETPKDVLLERVGIGLGQVDQPGRQVPQREGAWPGKNWRRLQR